MSHGGLQNTGPLARSDSQKRGCVHNVLLQSDTCSPVQGNQPGQWDPVLCLVSSLTQPANEIIPIHQPQPAVVCSRGFLLQPVVAWCEHDILSDEDNARLSMLLQSRFSTSYNDRQICLINYLKNKVNSGKCFMKSKYIARELGLSSKEVGTNMAILAETCPEFSIEKYSYSNSTTWLVSASQV